MGRLMVITTPNLVSGYQLAGVETVAVDTVEQAEAALRQLLSGDDASLVVVRRALLQAMPPQVQRLAERSYRPLVMAIPGSMPTGLGRERRYQMAELIRRAIGFHITFGGDQPDQEHT